MKKLVLIAAMLMVVAVLAGCGSSSSSSSEGPVGTVNADGTTTVVISDVTFTLPKGFTAMALNGGAEATNDAGETLSVFAALASEGEQRYYEGEYAQDWLQRMAESYAAGIKKAGKATYGDVGFLDVDGLEYSVIRGTAVKDGVTSHILVACTYHDKKRIAVLSITSDERDLALDVARAIK